MHPALGKHLVTVPFYMNDLATERLNGVQMEIF